MTEGSFKNGKIESKDINNNKRSVIGELKDWLSTKGTSIYVNQVLIKISELEENVKYECTFGFETRHIGKKGHQEPEKGERGFSTKRDDWVCRCGKTRRESLGFKCNCEEKKQGNWFCDVHGHVHRPNACPGCGKEGKDARFCKECKDA